MKSIILGTGRAVPPRVVTNDDLAKLMDTSDEWIRVRTGIQERHWINEGDSGVGLGKAAAVQALEMAGEPASVVDAIIYATSTPDHFAPGNGVFLQRELGLATIPAIDIRMQCAGFIFALSVADAYVRTGSFRRVLVVGQEIQSTRMEVSSAGRNTAVIFADGAGAVLLGPTEEAGAGNRRVRSPQPGRERREALGRGAQREDPAGEVAGRDRRAPLLASDGRPRGVPARRGPDAGVGPGGARQGRRAARRRSRS